MTLASLDTTARPLSASTPMLGSLVRRRRQQLGLTLRQLCERAGLSAGYLSQVENNKAVPALGTMAQIAGGLEVGLDYFVAQPKPADALSESEGRPRFSLPGSTVAYKAISSDYAGSDLSSYILHVPPGYVSETVTHEGEEIIVILEGEIEQMLGGAVVRMCVGDCMHYSGATPHALSNTTDFPARVLWTGTLSVLHRRSGRYLPPLPTIDNAGNDQQKNQPDRRLRT